MGATDEADAAAANANKALIDYDTDSPYADRLITSAQVQAIAAVALAIDRLAEAVENLQR